jgi:hypothetical protein
LLMDDRVQYDLWLTIAEAVLLRFVIRPISPKYWFSVSVLMLKVVEVRPSLVFLL